MESQRIYSLGLWTCCRSAGIAGLLASFVLSAAAAPPDSPYNVSNFGAAGGG
ncbi:MAG: hypothetical protein HYZ00_00150, partial [Candidatus Hydrogenedentes bacterium]|nr:hypothetical protein [Candidatus Hydrogenedentota bacterium]